jgi:hypothetical protein
MTVTMTQNSALQKIANIYESNPLMRAIVQVAISPVPYGIGSAIDTALTSKIENMREERLRNFFSELADGSHDLTEELIQSEEFLHAYFSTLKAAVNTRRKEKIKLFARLLLTASKEKHLSDEKYEEFLNILDDLSVRELHLLLILKTFEDTHFTELGANGENENDLQVASRFWEDFEAIAQKKRAVSSSELRAILNRLNRTGLYETFNGMYLGYTGGKGKLTPIFSQFVHWVHVKEDDFPQEGVGINVKAYKV